MESNNFLVYIEKLEDNQSINFDQIEGIVMNIEEIDYNLFKLSVIIEKVQYDGLFIKKSIELSIKKIYIVGLSLIKDKNKKNIKIFLKLDGYSLSYENNFSIIKLKEELKAIYDLTSEIPKILSKNNKKYDSDIFFYKCKKDNLITFTSFEKLKQIDMEITSNDNTYRNEIDEFFKKILYEEIISIENYSIKNDKININNFTNYYLADAEYMAEYFKNKYNRKENYYNQDIYINIPTKTEYNSNYLFIKIIGISDEYLIGIEQLPKIYKIMKYKDKLNEIKDIYTFILIRKYNIQFSDDISILTLFDNSSIYIFKNTLFGSFINDLTIISFNFPDFLSNSENYFYKIEFENNYSFDIIRKKDNIIINYKKGRFNYYLPYIIKIINTSEIYRFSFLLYYGLLNNINCFINYDGEDKYSCEYLYYNCNSLLNLPKFIIEIKNNKYIIENYDTFNSITRKRYVLINIPSNYYTDFYNKSKEEKKNIEKISKNKIETKKKNNIELISKSIIELKEENKIELISENNIEIKEENNIDLISEYNIEIKEENNINFISENNIEIKDEKEIKLNENNNLNIKEENKSIENDSTNRDIEKEININYQRLKVSLQFYFYFNDGKGTSNLIGIFNIEEIEHEKHKYLNEEMLKKYDFFYNYYKILEGEIESPDNYLEILENFKKDKKLVDLVCNYNNYMPIKYKNYIIYINMCLFFYYQIIQKFIVYFYLIKKLIHFHLYFLSIYYLIHFFY